MTTTAENEIDLLFETLLDLNEKLIQEIRNENFVEAIKYRDAIHSTIQSTALKITIKDNKDVQFYQHLLNNLTEMNKTIYEKFLEE